MDSSSSTPTTLRDEVRQVYLLTLRRLKERLEQAEPLTGAELQAPLRFCSDNSINVSTAQAGQPAPWSFPDLPFPPKAKEEKDAPASIDSEKLDKVRTELPFEGPES